jgi:energy-coupling factor transporter ATP-binding protein EcfA2
MNLQAIKFCRYFGEEHEWSIEGRPLNEEFNQWVTLSNINLIVGKNATGKSKTIDVVRSIADLLAGNVKLSNLFHETSRYHLLFDNSGDKIDYYLDFKNAKVVQELLKINEEVKLNRAEGKMYYEEVEKFLSFEIEDEILAVSRFDSKQQPFFENLYKWGKSLNHYKFGGQLGKNTLVRDVSAIKEDKEADFKDNDNVVEIFIRGKKKFGDDFVSTIIGDMSKISYDISSIKVDNLTFFPLPVFGLSVKENDIEAVTDQVEMSQGMFRALSLIIQLNYSILNKIPNCILIDDIGEGLDFDRSKSLIDLIIDKIQHSSTQVIMTTNDRFIMNKIPLEYWSVIHRISKKSIFYNYTNSKDIFEDFKYTGLSNFNFLSNEYYIGYENQEVL